MESNVYFITAVVDTKGQEDEYINLPVIQNSKAVGLVQKAEKTDSGMELTIAIWGNLNVEFIKYREGDKDVITPSSIRLNGRNGDE